MTYLEIYELCKKGKIGMIPGWKGYLKWDYSINLIYFTNNDYRLNQDELLKLINNRTDLYYII